VRQPALARLSSCAAVLAASLALALALAPSLAADPPRSPSSPPATAAGADLTQESPPAPPAERPTIRRLILQVDAPAPPVAELARALGRRLPELTLDLQADAPSRPPLAPPLGLQAHAAITQLGPEIYGLRLVLADGRAYARVIEAPPADATRALAGALASLIPAIDEADLPADEERAALPAPLAAAVHADLQPPAPLEPLPQPAPRSTDPTPDPTPGPTPDPTPPTPRTPPPPTPLTTLTVSLAAGALVGVGPIAAGWRGAPLDLLLARRGPRGLDLALDLRLTPRAFSLNDPEGSRAGEPLRLLRVRLALGVGATLRRRRFEAPLLTLFSVEPWQLRGPDGPLLLVSAADRGPPRPLLGVALRLAPGYRIPLARGRLHLRVGAHLEAALSGEARPGLPVPRLEAEGAPPFALGGLELFGGLALALNFAP
jgi:hypothetical protein